MILENKKKLTSNIFCFAWILMTIHMCVANSDLQNYNTSIVSYFSALLFGIKIIINLDYNKKEICMMILMLVLGFASYKITEDMRTLWFSIVLCASKSIDFNKVVKYTFITMFGCCVFFVVCYLFGISNETLIVTNRGMRHGIGLGHPNMCSAYYMLLSSQYIYIKYYSLKKSDIVLLVLGSVCIYFITKSITGFLTVNMMMAIVCALKYFSKTKLDVKIIVVVLLIIGILIFTLLPLVYNEKLHVLDSLLTGRLNQANYYYIKYGISFLGNNVNADLGNLSVGKILDIGYTRMLINNGLVYYLAVVLGYVILLLKAIKDNECALIALLSSFIIYMFTENVATYIFMNVSMLQFSNFIFKKVEKKENFKIMDEKIPKVIHYCWFGGNPLPDSAKRCIESWKKNCPDYEIREWNETNFNLKICKYVEEAFQEKKWAFISDYARFWIIYNHGGVYFDTDVELIKPIDELAEKGAFMGCEPALLGTNAMLDLDGMRYLVNPGLGFGASIHHPFVKEILDSFESRSFYKSTGEPDLTTIVETTTVLMKKYGFDGTNSIQKINGIIVYPTEYFCPKNYFTGELKLTKNTCSIHHYTASWKSDIGKKQFVVLQKLNSRFGENNGYKLWRIYTFPNRIHQKFSLLGFRETIKFSIKKITKK